MAILQVMQLQNYAIVSASEGECLFIAKRLNLTEETVSLAINRLLKSGAIVSHGDYHLPVSDFLMVPASIPSATVKKFHKQNIKKALESIEFQDETSVALKTTMLSIDRSDFTKIKDELGDFCKAIMMKYGKTRNSVSQPNQVCILTQQFFKVAEVKND